LKFETKFPLSVIPDLFRDLLDFCGIAGRSRHGGRELCVLLFLLFNLFTFFGFSQIPKETIKIGFLIRNDDDLAIKQTAQLAIEQANAQKENNVQKFELVIKSCDGPWGITSKQTVALIFEDLVPIVVTALDGRNAHLAEQVSAKSHVVMLSTLSSDPTLSRAYVPWYFRMVPDDRQQAKVLVEEIYSEKRANKVAIVVLDDYDGKKSAEAFIAEVKEKGYPEPKVFTDLSSEEIMRKSSENPWDAVVFMGSSNKGLQNVKELKASQYYAFLNYYNFIKRNDQINISDVKTIFSSWQTDTFWSEFQKEYKHKYNQNPSLAMAFVYDGILLAVESIKKYGPDTEAVRKEFKDLKYEGITGDVEFDEFGNRKH